jgi:transcriptional regulator with GAF, ATPase, and Fis domain
MESNAPFVLDYRFLATLLLEIAQERSLDDLLQRVARRALDAPVAPMSLVVVWLIQSVEAPAGAPPNADLGDRCLYAVAGGTRASDAPPHVSRLPDQLARVRIGDGPIGRVATTKEAVVLSDLDRDPGELAPIQTWLESERIRGCAVVPIVHRHEVLGVLAAFNRANLPPEMRQWGRVFADHVAVAIANARAFEQIQRLTAQLEEQNAYLREEVVEAKAFGDLVGRSAALSKVVHQIDLVAPTEASVLILGETGTGKELVAHEIHRRSQRRDKPLVRVNCASVPRDLYESEFFGHVKGAFTGAVKNRAGRFETAEQGTLFLDEVGEVPLDLQSKLLRVLQEKRYERVGDDRTRRADVRIIAATNRDLKKEVDAGRFREDLYYRLNVFPIQVAPLRERAEDIPLLAEHFVRRAVGELRCPAPRLTRAAVVQLQSYDWPGNVRELHNVIERAVILARGGALAFDLPTRHVPAATQSRARAEGEAAFLTDAELRARERDNLLRVLEQSHWKIKGADGAAELLGVNPNTLAARMKAMGIERPK